jgi:hypothetical protein
MATAVGMGIMAGGDIMVGIITTVGGGVPGGVLGHVDFGIMAFTTLAKYGILMLLEELRGPKISLVSANTFKAI